MNTLKVVAAAGLAGVLGVGVLPAAAQAAPATAMPPCSQPGPGDLAPPDGSITITKLVHRGVTPGTMVINKDIRKHVIKILQLGPPDSAYSSSMTLTFNNGDSNNGNGAWASGR